MGWGTNKCIPQYSPYSSFHVEHVGGWFMAFGTRNFFCLSWEHDKPQFSNLFEIGSKVRRRHRLARESARKVHDCIHYDYKAYNVCHLWWTMVHACWWDIVSSCICVTNSAILHCTRLPKLSWKFVRVKTWNRKWSSTFTIQVHSWPFPTMTI